MVQKQVITRIDDRVRLLSAVLAATNYPIKAQERRKHGTHSHARGTRKFVADHSHHRAVTSLQILLDYNIPLSAMYGYVQRLAWPSLESDQEMPRWVPPRWNEYLHHFYEVTKLGTWWASEDELWQTSMRQLEQIFSTTQLHSFFEPFFGPIAETFVFMPNICYPADQNIGLRVGGELITIMPPPMAWGDSAPWPYKDDAGLAYRAAVSEYGGLLMNAYLSHFPDIVASVADKGLPVDEKYAAVHPHWLDQFLGLFKAAATAIYLEQAVNPLEARSYIQHMQRVENLSIIVGIVHVFKRYLDEYKAGRYQTFIQYLPNVPKYLRVVKTLEQL